MNNLNAIMTAANVNTATPVKVEIGDTDYFDQSVCEDFEKPITPVIDVHGRKGIAIKYNVDGMPVVETLFERYVDDASLITSGTAYSFRAPGLCISALKDAECKDIVTLIETGKVSRSDNFHTDVVYEYSITD